MWLVRAGIPGAEVVGRWTHSAHGRMRTGETGERGLDPEPLAVRTQGTGSGRRGEGSPVRLGRVAGEPPVAHEVECLLSVGRAGGRGSRSRAERTFPRVSRCRWTGLRAKGFSLRFAAVSSLVTRWETFGQSRWILRAEEGTPRFLKWETLESQTTRMSIATGFQGAQ